MSHVKDILAGLGIFLVVIALIVAVFGGAIFTAQKNNQKVQHMNELCLAKGYSGWSSGYHDDASRCVR